MAEHITMNKGDSLFAIWGGIRQMARDLSRPASTVHGWKKEGRVPATEQHHVLAVGVALGLPITAEHVVFPLGRPDVADLASLPVNPPPVVCDRPGKAQ
ncbi:carph-isopro domain-containing protein [Sphingobium sp. AN558]|uniref:carph-isopro domain-containing protein n=1 Tax=Sphingobium sp. AN558 TaxID=3133442 RepID=UPI004040B437